MSAVWPLLIGVVFGALLDRGGLTRHERIVGAFRFTDLAVEKLLLTALVVGAALIEAARGLGLVAGVPIVPTRLVADAVGGALFGVGMAVAGFCPGTIAAAAGTGRLDALVPGVAGLIAGALVHDAFVPAIEGGALGPVSIPSLFGVSPWLVILLLAEIAALLIYVSDRRVE